jgi:uncharacterized protein
MYVEMKVQGFALDSIAQMPVIILKDADEKHSVPVWISASESVAFAAEYVGREMAVRNGRKDVFTSLVETMGMSIKSIVLESVRDAVFTCSIRLAAAGDEEVRLELHVSEAMLLSLKYRLPVLVDDQVLEEVATLDMNEEGIGNENNARRFVDFLDQLDPSSMGKYPM